MEREQTWLKDLRILYQWMRFLCLTTIRQRLKSWIKSEKKDLWIHDFIENMSILSLIHLQKWLRHSPAIWETIFDLFKPWTLLSNRTQCFNDFERKIFPRLELMAIKSTIGISLLFKPNKFRPLEVNSTNMKFKTNSEWSNYLLNGTTLISSAFIWKQLIMSIISLDSITRCMIRSLKELTTIWSKSSTE